MDLPRALEQLDERELTALRGAAVWYAKYHAPIIAQHADDESAYAVEERGEYLDLVRALEKLGVRVRMPDAGARSRAA